MKVYVNAFELKVTDAALTVDQFFSALVLEQYEELLHSDRQRVIAFGKRDGFFCGILLSTKKQRNFITVKSREGRPVVSVRRTRAGELMADVNYFVVNEVTGCGVFSAYQGSGGMTVFGNILHKLYRSEADKARDTELEELGETEDGDEDDDGHSEMARIKKKFWRATLELTPMLTDPKFASDLRKFAKYSRFDYVEPTLRDSRYKPIKQQITKQRRSLCLKTDGATKVKVRQFIASIVADYGISEGSVHGSLPNGEVYVLPINPEVYCLAKYPHDDVVTPANIRVDRVAQLPIIATLLGEVESRKELFV